MLGDYFCYSKTQGSAFRIKDALDQETIFNFELCVNLSIIIYDDFI